MLWVTHWPVLACRMSSKSSHKYAAPCVIPARVTPHAVSSPVTAVTGPRQLSGLWGGRSCPVPPRKLLVEGEWAEAEARGAVLLMWPEVSCSGSCAVAASVWWGCRQKGAPGRYWAGVMSSSDYSTAVVAAHARAELYPVVEGSFVETIAAEVCKWIKWIAITGKQKWYSL